MPELPVSPGGRKYGRLPDDPDQPDRLAHRLTLGAGIVLPPKATTSQWMGWIRDQGPEGSCTGQMGAEIRDFLYRKLYEFEKDKTILPENFVSSAAFVYQCNLIADGNLGTDVGSSIHQTIKTLNQKGVCLQSEEPYTGVDYMVAPTAEQYSEALTYEGGAYHNLPTLQEVKSCIASGYSCGIGIDVYESFEGSYLANNGFMPMPSSTENLLGGHAQHVLDYDDDIQFPDGSVGGTFIQNSWGSGWGTSAPGRTDRGCYWMPYAYYTAGHVSDMWIIHEGPAWKALAAKYVAP